MNIVRVEEFIVTGRRARTSNEREMKGEGVIGQLWSSGAPTASPLVAVYSEYESDKDGEYTYLLGRKIGEDETEPREECFAPWKRAHICICHSPGLFRQKRWSGYGGRFGRWSEGKIRRAYKTDFELYGGAGFDLYVGIKT